MQVKSSLWFTCRNGEQVGIVLVQDTLGQLYATIGTVHGSDEKQQMQWIAENGRVVPKGLAIAAFPGWDPAAFEPGYINPALKYNEQRKKP